MYTRWDGQRDRVANTGFWILKNDPRTFAMLLDLIECPSRVGIASQLVTCLREADVEPSPVTA